MEWFDFLEKIVGVSFLEDLTLVILVITFLRSHIKTIEISVEGIRRELHGLKGVFREQNKRIENIEGTQEALKYEVFEIKSDLKQLKKE